MTDSRVREDGWPKPEHVECMREIDYLRQRVEYADEVIEAARKSVSFEATRDDHVALINWLDNYGHFLTARADPAKEASA
jgi:hypothetical protein